MKNLFLLLLPFCFCISDLWAQNGWEYGSQLAPNGRDLWEAPNGDILVVMDDRKDIYLEWLDQDGQLMNTYKLPNNGGHGIREIQNMLRLADGHFLLIGYSQVVFGDPIEQMVIKVSSTGEILWETHIANTDWETAIPEKGFLDNENNVIITGTYKNFTSSELKYYATKLSLDGTLVWTKEIQTSINGSIKQEGADLGADGNIYIVSTILGTQINLIKINFEGELVSVSSNASIVDSGFRVFGMKTLPNGGVAILVRHISFESSKLKILLLDENFNLEQETEITDIPTPGSNSFTNEGGMLLDEDNNLVFILGHRISFSGTDDFLHQRIFGEMTLQGEIINQIEKDFISHYEIPSTDRFLKTVDNGYLFVGTYYDSPRFLSYTVKLDGMGNSLSNWVEGQLSFDQNEDCLLQDSELSLANWKIIAENNDFQYVGLTDDLGNYAINTGTGSYQLSVIPPNDSWTFCENDLTVNFAQSYDTLSQDFLAQAAVDCPNMWVDIARPFLRNCFDNEYSVDYCNYGTIAALDATIEITLDEGLSMVSADLPYTMLSNGNIEFEIGDLEVNQCDDFKFVIYADCNVIDLGETKCVMAHIFPDSICYVNPNWSGASMQVTGECVDDSNINFTITNIGNAPNTQPLEYIVVEDHVIMMQDEVTLNPAQSEVIPIAANGSTYRLEVEQELFHPGRSYPSVVIEGCGGISPGHVNSFAFDDSNDFIDIDCKEVVASYDPNDKTGFPRGYEDEHFIQQNTELEYLIRFQNTGTDTAFQVVIRDTLSAYLDVSTVRAGASSHPYHFDIIGGNILKFTFDNILLPDSTTNLEGSNGFVEFKIRQQANNPIGAEILNTAAIYFDFNAPIITNETLHTVGEALISDIQELQEGLSSSSVLIYPNPFAERATIEIKEVSFQHGVFELYDLSGKRMQLQNFNHSSFRIQRDELPTGTYSFIIILDGQASFSGKLQVF